MASRPKTQGKPLFLKPEEKRTGTQSLERAVNVLRAIASRGRHGVRLKDVAEISGLSVSTSFRMLQYLLKEGLLDKNQHSSKYQLGPLLYELGLLARPRYSLSEVCDQAMQNLAEKTQDTVYLSERSGLEAVCTLRKLGDYPVKVMPLDVGIRRPLGVGAGGLAILGAMPEQESESIIQSIGDNIHHFGQLTPNSLRKMVQQARARGYSYMPGATPLTGAVGVAFPAENPLGAISISAIASRMTEKRQTKIADAIKHEIKSIEEKLRAIRGLAA
jgi:DNA-binding IclR family transcriptional regulator